MNMKNVKIALFLKPNQERPRRIAIEDEGAKYILTLKNKFEQQVEQRQEQRQKPLADYMGYSQTCAQNIQNQNDKMQPRTVQRLPQNTDKYSRYQIMEEYDLKVSICEVQFSNNQFQIGDGSYFEEYEGLVPCNFQELISEQRELLQDTSDSNVEDAVGKSYGECSEECFEESCGYLDCESQNICEEQNEIEQENENEIEFRQENDCQEEYEYFNKRYDAENEVEGNENSENGNVDYQQWLQQQEEIRRQLE